MGEAEERRTAHAALLRGEQVRLLYASAGIALVTTPVAAVTLVGVTWSHVPPWPAVGWLAAVLAVALVRAVTVRRFWRRPPGNADVGAWRRRFVAGAAAAGLGWGAAGILFFAPTSVPWQMFLALVLAGVIMAAVPVLAPVLGAFFAFSIPALAPIAIRFLVRGDELGLAMTALAGLFGGGLALSALRMHQAIARALELAFENRDLVDRLSVEVGERTRAEAEVRAARDQLEQRVRERTDELRRTQAFLNTIVEHIPGVLLVKDATSLRFAWFNRAAERLLGVSREQILGRTDHDLFPPGEADLRAARDREVLAGRQAIEVPEEPVRTPHQGTRIMRTQHVPILDEGGAPAYLMACSEDVTERRQLEAELRQAQKLEALGRLAGGIAHDFNNLLTVIIGATEAWLEGTPAGDARRADVARVRRAAERAASLTSQLLAFSRDQVLIPRVLDVNVVIRQMADMLQRVIGEPVRLSMRLAPVRALVRVDPGQLEQILMNLILNGRDAVPGGGEIRIVTACVDVGASPEQADDLAPGPYLTIEVSDDGAGMTSEVMARVFEPFFTTKTVGKGTGMGLSTTYGIVRQSGGAIRVASTPGQGSTFTVFLPRVEGIEDGHPEPPPDPGPDRVRARVLLVEDEDLVRDFLCEVLEAAGCRVVTATNGEEALHLIQGDPGAIDVVVTDLVMPVMGGAELIARLGAWKPDLPVVFMSGYAEDDTSGLDRQGAVFLRKPLRPDALVQAIRDALRGRP